MRLTVIEDCWNTYASAVLPPETPENVRGFVRASFFAGVSFMYDTMINNCDDESQGVMMLESVTAELEAESDRMAKRIGMSLDEVRKMIGDEMRKKK